MVRWWKSCRQAVRGRATSNECLERRMCVATMAGRTTPRMRKALPMGRAAHQASLGVPGRFRPVNRGGACRNLRQGSGVHTHRQVVTGPVCTGIVMCAATNAMLRQPAFLLQFAGPSLRRAVTAPRLHVAPSGPNLAAAGVFPGAVGNIPLSAMHPMICPMGSDGVFNMCRI